jgi:putative Mg2+ transporter-C (MgtC) family protein
METVLLKLAVSLFLGLVIGLEREIRNKPLGIKTSIIICLSSCLITIISIESAKSLAVAGLNVMDPMRLPAQIISGIGFLGAGVILRKNNDVILGLTTAAMIWAAAGLGIAVGAGFYKEACLGVLFMIVSVVMIPMFIRRTKIKMLNQKEIRVIVWMEPGENEQEIMKNIESYAVWTKVTYIKDDQDRKQVEFLLGVFEQTNASDIYQSLKKMPKILQIGVENL